MAKRGGGANPTRDSGAEAASRAIAAHESSLKALKREVEAAAHQPSATRRHLYHGSSRVPCHMLYRRLAGNAMAGRTMFEPWQRFPGLCSTITLPPVGALCVNQPVTRCDLYFMIAKHYEGLAKEYRALAREVR